MFAAGVSPIKRHREEGSALAGGGRRWKSATALLNKRGGRAAVAILDAKMPVRDLMTLEPTEWATIVAVRVLLSSAVISPKNSPAPSTLTYSSPSTTATDPARMT